MEEFGNFTVSVTHDLAGGTSVAISRTADGDARMGQDPSVGEVSLGNSKAESESTSASNSDYKTTAQTGAASYVETISNSFEINPVTGEAVASATATGLVRLAAAEDDRLFVETPREATEDELRYGDFLARNRTDGRGSLPSGRTYFSVPGTPLGQGGVPLTGGLGNIGGGGALEPDAINGALERLGPGYREIALGIYRSADGTRQFRMTEGDLLGLHGDIGPHVHFESIGPGGKFIEENSHIYIIKL